MTLKMLRYSANLGMLWREIPFPERFQRAASAGFGAVEFPWLRGEDLNVVAAWRQAAGVQVVLINMDAGDLTAGERGFANDPTRREEWRLAFTQALSLAASLDCPRMNCLVGNELPGVSRQAQWDRIVENFMWAIPRAEQAGVTLLLEALNTFDIPTHLLARTSDSLALMDRLGDPRILRVQYDIYHMQRMEGNLIANIRAHAARFGHVQVADSPDRHQPGTGEVHWRNVLGTLEQANYDGYIGLEYVPVGTTEQSLGWLPYDKRRSSTAIDLNL